MFNISDAAALTVATDTSSALEAIDAAMLGATRLTMSAIEASSISSLPARETQTLFRNFHSTAGRVLEAREDMLRGITQLRSIQRRSTQAPVSFGCPGDTPISDSLNMSAIEKAPLI